MTSSNRVSADFGACCRTWFETLVSILIFLPFEELEVFASESSLIFHVHLSVFFTFAQPWRWPSHATCTMRPNHMFMGSVTQD